MSSLTDKQLEMWVVGLLERAERISGMLDQTSIPSIEVAELTGYAKSSLVLLNEKQIASYRQTHKPPSEPPTAKPQASPPTPKQLNQETEESQ